MPLIKIVSTVLCQNGRIVFNQVARGKEENQRLFNISHFICSMHQKIPVFLDINLSVGELRCKKAPCAVQMQAAPIPMIIEEIYM